MPARKPPRPERVIALIAGESGTGKSFAVANLKNALIFDTDLGGGLAYLDRRIAANGSERVEVGGYPDVLRELAQRRGRLGQFSTLAVDHLTTLQQEAVARHNPSMGEDFGKSYDKATREWRKFREAVRLGDFNLVCTAHLKSKYANQKVVGITTDASKNVEADFSQVVYLERAGAYPSAARVVKWRRDPEDDRGPVPATFAFSLERFVELHGSPLEGARDEEPMATPEQVARVLGLLGILKVGEDTVSAWFSKAKAEEWSDFTAEAIGKCIGHLEAKLPRKEGAA